MLRLYTVLLALLTIATGAVAQTASAPAKTTEKPAEPQIDYEQRGAPMPPLRYIVYRDTNTGNKMALAAALKNDTAHVLRAVSGKKKKHGKEVMAEGSKPVLTNEDLDDGANLFVMMFNPNCSHCQDETVVIAHNSDLFKRSKIVLLADPVMKSYLSDFISYTHVDQYSSFMYLGIDSSGFTKKAFLYRALPQINIYDKHQKLIKTYTGDVAIDSLKPYIQ